MKTRKNTEAITAGGRNTFVRVFNYVDEVSNSGVAAVDDFADEHAAAFDEKRHLTACVQSRGGDRGQPDVTLPTSLRDLLNNCFNCFVHRFSPVIATAGLVLIAVAAPMAHSQSIGNDEKSISIAELKRGYLLCNHAAISGRLNAAAIPQCSILYEELKRRAFRGDFYELLAWSKAHRSEPVPGQ